MAIDLLKSVQHSMGFPELKKIDPTSDEPVKGHQEPNADKLSQIVVPAVLAGIYNLSKSEEGLSLIASYTSVNNWTSNIFGSNKEKLLSNMSGYTSYQTDAIDDKVNEVATIAIKLIRENTQGGNLENMKTFISDQKSNILPYLHPSLQVGNLLDDGTIDDPTQKMEGPVSSLMHSIESAFSTTENEKDAAEKKDL